MGPLLFDLSLMFGLLVVLAAMEWAIEFFRPTPITKAMGKLAK